MSLWRRNARSDRSPDSSADAALARLARRDAALITSMDPRQAPGVVSLLAAAQAEMSRQFREDDTVPVAQTSVAEAQTHLSALQQSHATRAGSFTAAAHSGATDPTVSSDTERGNIAAVADESEQVRNRRAEERARGELAAAEQILEAAERNLVDALTATAQRAQRDANTYLAALNRVLAELGRQPRPLLDDEVIDAMFAQAVRQPRTSGTDQEV